MFRFMFRISPLVAALLLAAVATPLTAQAPLLTMDIPSVQAFGYSVDAMGDMNGDGAPDFVVGTVNDDTFDTDAGSVRIVSGADGSILLTRLGTEKFENLGETVVCVGDIDGDGVTDFAATSKRSDALGPDVGAVLVMSGATGAVIHALGDVAYKPFGASVAALGDLDGDGITEIVGSASFNGPPGDRGAVIVFDGATGAQLWSFPGVAGVSQVLGRHLAPLDDVNGDGHPDLLTSDANDMLAGQFRGRVWVLSGIDGSVIHEWAGSVDYERLGTAVAAAGDVDADGTPDMLVSCNKNDQGLSALISSVHVYSGATGLRLLTVLDTEYANNFGTTVAGLGDRNGDGHADFGVSTLAGGVSKPGVVDIYSGADGAWVARMKGSLPGDQFGRTIATLGDLDGDGNDDLVVGAPGSTNHFVRVMSLAGSFAVTGAGLAGTGGLVPKLSGFGFPEGGGSVEIRLVDGRSVASSFTFVGFAPAALPFKQGTLWVAPPWTIVSLNLSGAGGFAAPVALDPSFSGLGVHLQTAVQDPVAPAGWALSNGLFMAVN